MKRLALLTLLLLSAPACTIYLDDPGHADDPGAPDAQPWVPDDARELDAVTPWPHDDAPPYAPDAQPWPPEDAPPGCGLDAGPGPGLPDAGPGPGLPDAQPWPQPDAQPYP